MLNYTLKSSGIKNKNNQGADYMIPLNYPGLNEAYNMILRYGNN
jgi:hypothetical protein